MTRNLVTPEVAEANRAREGAYTFHAPIADDYDGIAFTVAVLRVGDHAHLDIDSGRAIPQPESVWRSTQVTRRGKAGYLILRWQEWEALRAILEAADCVHIAEVERPTPGQMGYHIPGAAESAESDDGPQHFQREER